MGETYWTHLLTYLLTYFMFILFKPIHSKQKGPKAQGPKAQRSEATNGGGVTI